MYKMDEVKSYHAAGFPVPTVFNNMKNKYPDLTVEWLYDVYDELDKQETKCGCACNCG